MKVAIIGTVGVPANYGGFETLVENLLEYRQHSEIVYQVYCSSKAYGKKLSEYKGAKLVYISLRANGWQSLIYDSISLLHACFTTDAILALGCSCPIYPLVKFLCRKKLVVNVDGVEAARDKWNSIAKIVLNYCTRGAISASDECISDNEAIQQYVKKIFSRDSKVIEYGGNNAVSIEDNGTLAREYGVRPGTYLFKVARIEPENNIKMILDAVSGLSGPDLIIIGNWNRSEYGRTLRANYGTCEKIHMLDPIYDLERINLLRSNCLIYLHGHSAGGTNPSLVEAMNSKLPVFAYDVCYNRATTEGQALYFKSADELKVLIQTTSSLRLHEIADALAEVALRRYRWEIICDKYEHLFL